MDLAVGVVYEILESLEFISTIGRCPIKIQGIQLALCNFQSNIEITNVNIPFLCKCHQQINGLQK